MTWFPFKFFRANHPFVIVLGIVFLFFFVIFFYLSFWKGVIWCYGYTGVDVDIVGPLKNVTAVPCKKGSQYWPSSYNSCPPAPVHPENVYDNFWCILKHGKARFDLHSLLPSYITHVLLHRCTHKTFVDKISNFCFAFQKSESTALQVHCCRH